MERFTGTFTASGPAVDAGMMCPEGAHWTNSWERIGTGPANWRIEEGFRCHDGSGGFTIIETVTRASAQDDNPEMVDIFGDWTLTDGSGVYEGMSGEGTYEGFDSAVTGNGTEEESGQIWRDD